MTAPITLRTDFRVDPRGVESAQPEFSWRLPDGLTSQRGCQVQVAAGDQFDTTAMNWDSGCVGGPRTVGLPYGGSPLASKQQYLWRVRVWSGDNGAPGPWSVPARFETGILDPALWQAQWITGPPPAGKKDRRALYLRGEALVPAAVVRARAYVSALGWYRLFVNGHDLTGNRLVPRWTPFDDYVEYQIYDVSDVVRQGQNIVAMAIGDGRFRGHLGFNSTAVYGDRLAGLVQIELQLEDGSAVTLSSDDRWSAGTGQISNADPKLGEDADLRITQDGWLTEVRPPAHFCAAQVILHRAELVAEEVPPVGEIQRLPARSIRRTPSGRQVVDFGQNFAGVVRVRLTGPRGSVVALTHSEVLTATGELDTGYLGPSLGKRRFQRDEVVLDGANGWYQPWFTIHGFRHVEIDGMSADLEPCDIEGIVLSSQLDSAGHFECSDTRLNGLWHNVLWSLRSNFVDTPTDCPTRERSGWTGDIAVFAPTATVLVDAQAFLRRYLRNLANEQLGDGRVPVVIPAETGGATGWKAKALALPAGSVGWGDAAVLLPWTLYRYYGDQSILHRQYDSMTAWVDYLARRARTKRRLTRRWHRTTEHDQYLLDTGFHFGEWLRPDASLPVAGFDGLVHGPVLATAYFEHSTRTLSNVARVVGRDVDADHYAGLADEIRHAWRTAFLHSDGRIGTDRQDDYVRALAFGLLEPGETDTAVGRLVELIEAADGHLGTGFLSTPMLLPVLVDGGRADVAWHLLLQTTSPSWLHQVECGATTIWETWNGYDDKGRARSSHNHYAFGAVANFLTERVAGITPAEPGYQLIDINPLIGGGLSHARATIQTPHGQVSSHWQREGSEIRLDVTVAPGTSARVHTGPRALTHVGPGEHRFAWVTE